MIIKTIDEHRVLTIPEESDDLLILRRIIKKGDNIVADTSRVIKQDKQYARPDRGDKIKIRLALDVDKISLDNALDRLRIHGVITESSNESVSHGMHHSFLIKPNDPITITKKRWDKIEEKLLKTKNDATKFLLVALDTNDCGIATLKGTRVQIMPNIYSGSSGKRYKTSFNIERFFDDILVAINSIISNGNVLIIFGPGQTKKKFVNYFNKKITKYKIDVVEGIDSAGEDGIYTFVKSAIMQEILSSSKLAIVLSIIDKVMYLANKTSNKFTMGFKDTSYANSLGAIESLVFSDKIIQTQDEQEIIEFLNKVEATGAKVYGVDSTTDIGLRVTGLGGMVALLRFAV